MSEKSIDARTFTVSTEMNNRSVSTGAIAALIWFAGAFLMNLPIHPLTDPAETLQRINDREAHVFVDKLYLLSGFPIFYGATEFTHNGAETFYPNYMIIGANFLLSLIGILAAFLYFIRKQFSLRRLFAFVSIAAVFLASLRFSFHLTYFYVSPVLFYFPLIAGVFAAILARVTKKR